MSDDENDGWEIEVVEDDEECPEPRAIDRFAFDEDEDDERIVTAPKASAADDELVPFNNVVGRNPDVVRREYVVTDGVSYYNQVALWTLLYGRATQGHAMPPLIFDSDKQTM